MRRLAVARPDDPLWAVLLRRCEELIRRSLWWQLGNRGRAAPALLDDLAQEVMERLLSHDRRGLLRFTGQRDETFDGYIRRIAENILLDQFRHDEVRLEQEYLLPPEELWQLEASLSPGSAGSAENDPEAGVSVRELSEVVERTLRQISLNDRQRALNRLLFRLYFMDGCSIPQISRLRAVTLSSSSVARRLNLIRKALQKSFSRRPRAGSVRRKAVAGRKRRGTTRP